MVLKMIHWKANRRMKESLDREIQDWRDWKSAEERGIYFKLTIGQSYSYHDEDVPENRDYFDSVHITPEQFSADGDHIPYEITGHFPRCADIANFAVTKNTSKGIQHYQITYGRTGNDTVFGKPVRTAFSENGIRMKLHQLLEETVQRISAQTGMPLRAPGEARDVAYSALLLTKQKQK